MRATRVDGNFLLSSDQANRFAVATRNCTEHFVFFHPTFEKRGNLQLCGPGVGGNLRITGDFAIPKGLRLMKLKVLTLAMLLFTGPAWAQTAEMSKNAEPGEPARAAGDIVPLPSIKSLTAPQAAGKKLFVQRCSVCHLPALPSYTTYGPVLSGSVISALGDEAARE